MQSIESLPKPEWDFRKAVTEFGVDEVFFYEYCRSAAKEYPDDFLPLIENAKLFNPWLGEWRKSNKKNRKKASELIFKHPFGEYLIALSGIKDFPESPLIENEDYRKRHSIHNVFKRAPLDPLRFHHLDLLDLNRDTWSKSMGEPITEIEGSPSVSISNETFQQEKGITGAPLLGKSGFSTFSLIEVNWGFTDGKLKDEFHEFLKRNRPKRYKKFPKSDKQIGVYGIPLSFARGIEKGALGWLGYWRRKQHAGTKKKLYELYPENTTYETVRDKARKAESIIKWFAKGGILISTRRGDKIHKEVKY